MGIHFTTLATRFTGLFRVALVLSLVLNTARRPHDLCAQQAADAPRLTLKRRAADPYGSPRPAPGQNHVPLGTTFLVELEWVGTDGLDANSVSLRLEATDELPRELCAAGRSPDARYRLRFAPGEQKENGGSWMLYADGGPTLRPATSYTLHLDAKTRGGVPLAATDRSWSFTTERQTGRVPLQFSCDLKVPPVTWHGGFFTGLCGTSFATTEKNRLPTFELINAARQGAPLAWSLYRGFWMTGMEHQPEFLAPRLPGIVRERETRRITMIEDHGATTVLQVEDFPGHSRYGVPPGRPLSDDYHPGDVVLIADGVSDARSTVRGVDNAQQRVTVDKFAHPPGGWKLARSTPSVDENSLQDLPAPGGCYLRKFAPVGTPVYYWGRLDQECDLLIKRFGTRIVANFADAPGDLAIDGRNWTTAKDYAELHDVTRAMTSHLIERYGDACLEFPWSVFNEPDLGKLFWRTSWDELQRFYDYTVDGILRAFEDHGYDSSRVRVGGLELGGIFGTNLRLREFLVHCSPQAPPVPGALLPNAAFADARLHGKRSRRVEELCRAHGGRGSPCDFISIHSYNAAPLMAAKLIRAKAMALEIDANFFTKLAVHSHESCPGWSPPPDPAFGDSYLGNGYFATWCADVARRRLAQAARDPRYADGEMILTVWPWPPDNFEGRNDIVQQIHQDKNGDGKSDGTVTVASPILHFLAAANSMGNEFHVLPEQTVEGHSVSGFVAQEKSRVSVLLYAHHPADTESRSDKTFVTNLRLENWGRRTGRLHQFRFDKDHNSYFHRARELREAEQDERESASRALLDRWEQIAERLKHGDRQDQQAVLQELSGIRSLPAVALQTLYAYWQSTSDEELRRQAMALVLGSRSRKAYPPDVIAEIERLSQVRPTGTATLQPADDGSLAIDVEVAANGANFLTIEEGASN